MHAWHDVYVDDEVTNAFPVMIEVPSGSRNTCELDEATGLLRLHRVRGLHRRLRRGQLPQRI